jgi:hypothetical protein
LEFGRADVRQRVDHRLLIIQVSRKLERASTPGDCSVEIRYHHAALRDVAIGHRQFMPWRHAFKQLDRLQRPRLPLLDAADEEQQAGQRPQRVSLSDQIRDPPPAFERFPLGLDRGFELIGQPALVDPALQ